MADKLQEQTLKLVWKVLLVICPLTLVPELFMDRHGHFGFDEWPTFYAIFGFVACAAIVLFSKFLGYLLKRPENYFEGKKHD